MTWLTRWRLAIGGFLWSEREELTALLGLVLVGSGLWMVSKPAALIVCGGFLLWMTLPTRRPFVQRPIVVTKRQKRSAD